MIRKCPVHGEELVYVGIHEMGCPVKGCTHVEYNPVVGDNVSRITLPWWAQLVI